MKDINQKTCQSSITYSDAQLVIADFMRAKRGRTVDFFNRYYKNAAASYRTIHRVLFDGDEDYHGIWEKAAIYYSSEKEKEEDVKESIIKTIKQ